VSLNSAKYYPIMLCAERFLKGNNLVNIRGTLKENKFNLFDNINITN
jgi:hypothetical protein